jgi:hypothetical protein
VTSVSSRKFTGFQSFQTEPKAADARRYGYTIDWHVAEDYVANKLREEVIRQHADDVTNVYFTP